MEYECLHCGNIQQDFECCEECGSTQFVDITEGSETEDEEVEFD